MFRAIMGAFCIAKCSNRPIDACRTDYGASRSCDKATMGLYILLAK